MESYKVVDTSEWARHFPTGYRERMAPSCIAEMYKSGQSLKTTTKAFLKDRHIEDCAAAREMLPTAAAIDAIILQDQQPEAINSVVLEKLVRKWMGTKTAFAAVKTEKDWKRPGKDSKNWKSLVDFESWKRIDPAKDAREEDISIPRKVETEIRAEMDRDATLIKAKSKLQESEKDKEVL